MNLKKVLIIFYGREPKQMELYYLGNAKDIQKYTERVVELTKARNLFSCYELGECVGDFS